uniref:Uncharacterized protein n=1 Tax=Hyaloperonospora arabidopsidis (strain Emoy2) TaxID=559515 RepID=M4BKP7_HYAAE
MAIKINATMSPHLSNAKGRDKIPPPMMVLTRLKIADGAVAVRAEDNGPGLKNSWLSRLRS